MDQRSMDPHFGQGLWTTFRLQGTNCKVFRQADDESVESSMARCKIKAQKCWFSDAQLEERLIQQIIIGTRELKI